jgi:hypothetical protein
MNDGREDGHEAHLMNDGREGVAFNAPFGIHWELRLW